MSPIITVSESASEYLKKKIVEQSGLGFRLSVTKKGCSGFAYLPSIVDKENPRDTHIEIAGIHIFLDTIWLHLLQGIHIDYIEDTLTGIKQKRLVFINPKEESRCGCGESFHV